MPGACSGSWPFCTKRMEVRMMPSKVCSGRSTYNTHYIIYKRTFGNVSLAVP